MEQENWIQFGLEVNLKFEEAFDIRYDLIEERELIQSAKWLRALRCVSIGDNQGT